MLSKLYKYHDMMCPPNLGFISNLRFLFLTLSVIYSIKYIIIGFITPES